MPNAAVFGVLADPAFPATRSVLTDLQTAARALGLQLIVVDARADSDLETAFATFSQQRVGAVLVGISNFFSRRIEKPVALAARHALPAIFPFREYALAGGVEQATKLELVINLKTAKALGLTIPETLLATADGRVGS